MKSTKSGIIIMDIMYGGAYENVNHVIVIFEFMTEGLCIHVRVCVRF